MQIKGLKDIELTVLSNSYLRFSTKTFLSPEMKNLSFYITFFFIKSKIFNIFKKRQNIIDPCLCTYKHAILQVDIPIFASIGI